MTRAAKYSIGVGLSIAVTLFAMYSGAHLGWPISRPLSKGHRQLQTSRVAQSKPGPLTEKEVERHKRLIEMYGSFGELILADMRADSSVLYITPREVWKGKEYEVGRTVTFPRTKEFDWLVGSGSVTWILGFRHGNLLSPNSPAMYAGTDGIRMGGENGVLLDEFRAYYAPKVRGP